MVVKDVTNSQTTPILFNKRDIPLGLLSNLNHLSWLIKLSLSINIFLSQLNLVKKLVKSIKILHQKVLCNARIKELGFNLSSVLSLTIKTITMKINIITPTKVREAIAEVASYNSCVNNDEHIDLSLNVVIVSAGTDVTTCRLELIEIKPLSIDIDIFGDMFLPESIIKE